MMNNWRQAYLAPPEGFVVERDSLKWVVVKYGVYVLAYKLIGNYVCTLLVKRFPVVADVVSSITALSGSLAHLLPWSTDIMKTIDQFSVQQLNRERLEFDIRKHTTDTIEHYFQRVCCTPRQMLIGGTLD